MWPCQMTPHHCMCKASGNNDISHCLRTCARILPCIARTGQNSLCDTSRLERGGGWHEGAWAQTGLMADLLGPDMHKASTNCRPAAAMAWQDTKMPCTYLSCSPATAYTQGRGMGSIWISVASVGCSISCTPLVPLTPSPVPGQAGLLLPSACMPS